MEKIDAEYIFLEAKDDVDELASFMNANPQKSNHIAINLSGFSNGFDAFQKACASSQ
jgi:hypothetical protein